MTEADKVKNALRLTTGAFDDEISNLIAACKADLELAGVTVIKSSDALIVRALVLYAKANFGYSEDSEKYQRAYNDLKCRLCLAGGYNG